VSSRAAWAGIIVADAVASAAWYARELGAQVADRDEVWVKLVFPNSTEIELFSGDRSDPGGTFPSYGLDSGPPVLPGYAVEDPTELVEEQRLEVVRVLPGWVVVVAPDRLRVVLTAGEPADGPGLVGFRFTAEDAAAQRSFLDALAVPGVAVEDGAPSVVPVVRCRRRGDLVDPDGTRIVCVGPRG
jgi:catechol 2,3-dioxygenase-like lactoylglutathione lyase family enzyme